ncbi:MAG: AAA-like domain-containing protein, partial [Cyanobacteriota bacterium]|nr:AAA-like domain-containing protein [Cyanobacteriota bacterium]
AYQVGGCLPEDAPSYVVRKADDVLYKSLLEGEFCYVLNSRQMGKSSLRVRTMKKLQEADIACAVIDLTAIGTYKVTPEKWYGGLIKIILNHFELTEKVNLRTWLRERDEVTPVQCFCEFIEEILLVEVPQKIVIFIDEIDSVLRLEFKDDFFALIRACYNKRAEQPVYKRLSFVLLGVATPSDLINDKTRTPFNTGRAIELRGFQLNEVKPLIRGIEKKTENAQAVIKEILYWTRGQPFLTQKLCQLVYAQKKDIPPGSEELYITKLVRKHIIENWETQDEPEHLKTIRNRLLQISEQRSGRLLGLYQLLLQQREVLADESLEQTELRLTGLVVKRDRKLQIYNHIYAEVFNQGWCEQELAKLRPYAEALNTWLISERQDESRLLRGQTLQDAQTWATGKSLSDLDYQFLAASQGLDKREVQIALEAERTAKQVLEKAQEKANQRLAEAQRKAKWQIGIGAAVLGLSIIGAVVVVNNVNQRLESTILKFDQEQQKLIIITSKLEKAEKAKKEAVKGQQAAQAAREEAEQNAQQAKKSLEEAQVNLNKVNQNINKKTIELQQAQAAREETEQNFQQVKKSLYEAKVNLNKVNKQLQQTFKVIGKSKNFLESILTLSEISPKLKNYYYQRFLKSIPQFIKSENVSQFKLPSKGKPFIPSNVEQSINPNEGIGIPDGMDDRILMTSSKYPWSTIGRIEGTTTDAKSYSCTGTLISNNIVLTTAHCVINTQTGEKSTEIKFLPNLINGKVKDFRDISSVKKVIFGTDFKNGSQDNAKDWAILLLDKPLGLKYGYLGWKSIPSSILIRNKNAFFFVGYSNDFPKFSPGMTAGFEKGCSITGEKAGLLLHDCNT